MNSFFNFICCTFVFSLLVLSCSKKVIPTEAEQKPTHVYSNIDSTLEYFSYSDTIIRRGNIKKLNIEFELDSDILRKSSYPDLDSLAQFLEENPTIQIEIQDHLWTWSDNYSHQLSDMRAYRINEYLFQKGISPYRIESVGYYDRLPYVIQENDSHPLVALPKGSIVTYENLESYDLTDLEIRSILQHYNDRTMIKINFYSAQ